MKDNSRVYDISTLSIFKVVIILLSLAFLWLIRDVLGLVFVAIILASAFDPAVDWLQKIRIPRGIGIIAIFILILGALGSVVYLVSGPIVEQVSALAANFPHYYDSIVGTWHKFQSLGGVGNVPVSSSLGNLGLPEVSNFFGFVSNLFGSIFAFFLVLVMTFYLTIEEENMRRFIRSLAPTRYQPYLMQLISKVQTRLGYWLRGWLILSVIIFILSYVGLTLMGVKYALVLALLAGALEIVPFLGPILAAIPAIFLAFQQSPFLAMMVVILYVVIQQIENNVVVPKIMGKVTGLNPIIVLVAVLIGAKIGGMVGALLAVPVATALAVFMSDFGNSKPS